MWERWSLLFSWLEKTASLYLTSQISSFLFFFPDQFLIPVGNTVVFITSAHSHYCVVADGAAWKGREEIEERKEGYGMEGLER